MATQDPDEVSSAIHRQLAVSLFNRSWNLHFDAGARLV